VIEGSVAAETGSGVRLSPYGVANGKRAASRLCRCTAISAQSLDAVVFWLKKFLFFAFHRNPRARAVGAGRADVTTQNVPIGDGAVSGRAALAAGFVLLSAFASPSSQPRRLVARGSPEAIPSAHLPFPIRTCLAASSATEISR